MSAELSSGADAVPSVDITFRVLDSPIGFLLVAASVHGLVRLAFEAEGHDAVLQGLGIEASPRIKDSTALLDSAANQLDEYFAGTLTFFDLALDERVSRGFRREVLRHLARIPYGVTESYGEVAVAVGRPRASRAAGTACATNPWPIIVPCHRVVRSDGSIGSYLAGPQAKRLLLDLESQA